MQDANNHKKFPPNTAGAKMITNVPCANKNDKILDVEIKLLKTARNLETIDYVYVVNSKNELRGVVSVREILQVPNKLIKIEKIMKKKLIYAHSLTHQERIVYLALKHDIKAIPVVDKKKRFLGIVPYNTILNIFHDEVHDDIFRFVGICSNAKKEINIIKARPSKLVKARLPCLFVGLIGGLAAASIVGVFEQTLSTYITLAMFMPVLVYMSDAIGTQSETLIVRSIALDPKLAVKSYFIKEIKVGLLIALVCSTFLALAAMLGWGTFLFGIVIGLSMFLSILVAVLVATLLPLLLRKLNFDPAIAAGPFATVITDIITIVIYFSVATLLLSYFS